MRTLRVMPGALSGARAAAGEYARRVGEFSRDARLFLGAATLGGIGAGVSAVLFNLYVVAVGNSEGDVLRVLSFGPLGAAAGAILAGPLIDLWGPKRSMLAGSALSGAGALAMLLVAAPLVLRAGVALSSLGAAVVYIAYAPFLSLHSSPRERAYLFGATAAAYVVSTAAGRLLGGALPSVIATADPLLSKGETYRLALLCGVILSGLSIPLLVWVRDRPRGAVAGEPADPASHGVGTVAGLANLAGLVRWLRHGLLRRDLALMMVQFIVFDGLIRLGANLVVPVFNIYFVRHLGATETQYGALASAERVIVVFATLLAAPLAIRFGPVATVAVTQVLSVPLLLTLGFAGSLPVASGALLLRGALMEMTVPTRDQFLMDVMPAWARATAFSALMIAGYAVSFVAYRAGSRLLDAGQLHTAFVMTSALYTLSALLFWLFFRSRPEAAPRRAGDLSALAVGGGETATARRPRGADRLDPAGVPAAGEQAPAIADDGLADDERALLRG